jgi:hypothetical protein
MKMSADIDQFSYDKQFAMLTQLYLELSLSVRDALRAAEADLYSPEDLETVSQSCHWTFPTRSERSTSNPFRIQIQWNSDSYDIL